MKFDKDAAQRQLDLAATELENAGFADLAEKVDYFSNRLIKAKVSEVPLIKRALHRLQQEAKRRFNSLHDAKPATNVDKARAATQNASRAKESRKEILKRRLKTIVANREKAARKLEVLREARQSRRTGNAERRYARNKRLSK